MKYKKGWLVKRVREASKDFDKLPESFKKALELNVRNEK